MKDNEITQDPVGPIHIMFADDDNDDHFFFDRALKRLPFHSKLTTVKNGEELMNYLFETTSLPDVLFLDYNMPRKNGFECLLEIKLNTTLKELPVIIYSTNLHEDIADLMYEKGAYFYIRKTSLEELEKSLSYVFTLIVEKKLDRPSRKDFIINSTGFVNQY